MKISVGITTRNRIDALRRCLASIDRFLPDAEVLVFDDQSDVPVAQQLADRPRPTRFIRDAALSGYIAGRNAIVHAASHDAVLLMDDDAFLLDQDAVRSALDVLERDSAVAAVAFAQAEADGRPWPEGMQAGVGTSPQYVKSFIGFAHLLRRGVFLRLGGYRSDFVFYGEEKDYCLRLLDAGFRTVYLPDARIAHVPDPSGRDHRRWARYAIRNDCLGALYNDPWPLVVVGIPLRLLRFRRMVAGIPGGDPGGMRWLVGELRGAMGGVLKRRQAVKYATVREWRRLGPTPVPYPSVPSHD